LKIRKIMVITNDGRFRILFIFTETQYFHHFRLYTLKWLKFEKLIEIMTTLQRKNLFEKFLQNNLICFNDRGL